MISSGVSVVGVARSSIMIMISSGLLVLQVLLQIDVVCLARVVLLRTSPCGPGLILLGGVVGSSPQRHSACPPQSTNAAPGTPRRVRSLTRW